MFMEEPAMDDEAARLYRISREKRTRIARRHWSNYKAHFSTPDVNLYRQAHAEKVKLIDDILEEYLRIPLLCAESYFAASLIYNDDEGPIWYLDKSQHGKDVTKKAIEALKRAEQVLDGEEAWLGGDNSSADVSAFRQNLAAILTSIPAGPRKPYVRCR
ncbi:hypothetical protein AL036_22205, partial [Salipiger aestuarii]